MAVVAAARVTVPSVQQSEKRSRVNLQLSVQCRAVSFWYHVYNILMLASQVLRFLCTTEHAIVVILIC